MKKLKKQVCQASLVASTIIILMSPVRAKETIVQQEKISFEKCLKVITKSRDKLSVAPKITDVTDQMRVAIFKLVDGTLTIKCDRKEGNITVLTNTN